MTFSLNPSSGFPLPQNKFQIHLIARKALSDLNLVVLFCHPHSLLVSRHTDFAFDSGAYQVPDPSSLMSQCENVSAQIFLHRKIFLDHYLKWYLPPLLS
jgi:hypothetical protein